MAEKEWFIQYTISENHYTIDEEVVCLLKSISTKTMAIKFADSDTREIFCRTPMKDEQQLKAHFKNISGIAVSVIRESTVFDRLMFYYGWDQPNENSKTFRFTRDELHLLVEFLGTRLKEKSNLLIGIRGMPRVGKSEVVIAASVYANKRWLLVSSTLQRLIVRNHLTKEELSGDNVYIIDGIVSTTRGNARHKELLDSLLKIDSPKVIEHPDVFVRETDYSLDDFDYIIELRNNNSETITYDNVNTSFSSFDIS